MSNIYEVFKAKGMGQAELDVAKFADALYNGVEIEDLEIGAEPEIPPLTYELARGHYIDNTKYSLADVLNLREIYQPLTQTPLIIQFGYTGCGASDIITNMMTGKTAQSTLEEFLDSINGIYYNIPAASESTTTKKMLTDSKSNNSSFSPQFAYPFIALCKPIIDNENQVKLSITTSLLDPTEERNAKIEANVASIHGGMNTLKKYVNEQLTVTGFNGSTGWYSRYGGYAYGSIREVRINNIIGLIKRWLQSNNLFDINPDSLKTFKVEEFTSEGHTVSYV